MAFIKLKEYCKNHSISYTTGYRWFKNNQIPGAYKTSSGTILVDSEEVSPINNLSKNDQIDPIYFLLDKCVEFQNNEASLLDFTAYILSNFTLVLKENSSFDSPAYSKKSKNEAIQAHYKKIVKIRPEEEIERLKEIKENFSDKDNKDRLIKFVSSLPFEDIDTMVNLFNGVGSINHEIDPSLLKNINSFNKKSMDNQSPYASFRRASKDVDIDLEEKRDEDVK